MPFRALLQFSTCRISLALSIISPRVFSYHRVVSSRAPPSVALVPFSLDRHRPSARRVPLLPSPPLRLSAVSLRTPGSTRLAATRWQSYTGRSEIRNDAPPRARWRAPHSKGPWSSIRCTAMAGPASGVDACPCRACRPAHRRRLRVAARCRRTRLRSARSPTN